MDTQQVVPVRTPEQDAKQLDIITVIGQDGRVDPRHDPKLPVAFVRKLYEAMIRTRVIDERLVALQRQGRIGFHIGSLGEEACILASGAAMREQDWVFPCYREFSVLLWRGMPLQTYMHNMFGNSADPAKGRQMPDHYTGRPYRYGSVSSPIGTQITQAAGFAWAAKMRGENLVTSSYIGEGGSSSNDFHTGLNFAGVFKLPTVIMLRNNRWAISVPSDKQTASATFAEKGLAYGIPGVRVDGNDVLASYKVCRDAVERAARGEGPTLIELMTYRMGGHSTSDDPRAYRDNDEVEGWRRTDPLIRTRKYLESLGAWTEADEQGVRTKVEGELKVCIETAEKTAPPSLPSMFEDVYKEMPWHLREQQAECEQGPRAKSHH